MIIEFEGQEYNVPDWVRYVARDDSRGMLSATVYGYEFKPFRQAAWWCSNPVGGGKLIKLGKTTTSSCSWEKSLMKVV